MFDLSSYLQNRHMSNRHLFGCNYSYVIWMVKIKACYAYTPLSINFIPSGGPGEEAAKEECPHNVMLQILNNEHT